MKKVEAQAELRGAILIGHAASIYSANQSWVDDWAKRNDLTRAECQKRDVRFLPAQVMRPIFRAAGV
jgi:hypothetical protein